MKKSRVLAGLLAALMLLAGCEQEQSDTVDDTAEKQETVVSEETDSTMAEGQVTSGSLPGELAQIPQEYFEEADQQGTLVELEYDTYESMTYEEEEEVLHKRAIVYLPYGHSADSPWDLLQHGGHLSTVWIISATSCRPAEALRTMEKLWRRWYRIPDMTGMTSLSLRHPERMILPIPLSKTRLRQWQTKAAEHSVMRITKGRATFISSNRTAALTTGSMRWNIFITDCAGSGSKNPEKAN